MKSITRLVLGASVACLVGLALSATAGQELKLPLERSMKYTSRSPGGAGVWQKDVRTRLYHLLKLDALLAEKDAIGLDPKELYSAGRGSYRVRELEVNSTPGRRIRIIVTTPASLTRPFPAVVCIGGHGSSLHSPYSEHTVDKDDKSKRADRIYKGFATVLAREGYVTVSVVVSQHEVYEDGRLLMGERLWDLIRCVDYLESVPEVDRSKIGCGGLSLGGEMAMWLGAMDERIAACVSAGFLTTMDHMEQNHCMCWKFEGLRDIVDFADIYSLVAPRALQCQNGLLEPPSQFNVPLARRTMEEIRTIYGDLGRPENMTLDVHSGAHEIDLPGLLYFFDKHLYDNRWTGSNGK